MNGFEVGDLIVEHEHNYGSIVEFKFCKNNNQVMPVITANGRTYFTHWDYLRKTQNLEQFNLFKPLDEGDTNEPPEGDFMETQAFKAITIHPPMSEMIARGIKDVENRPMSYNGKLLIHASKTYNQEQAQWIKDNIGIEAPTPEECQIGGIVAIADIETTEESSSVWAMEDAKYYWKIKSVQPVKFYPCKGQQGLFNCEIPVENLREEKEFETLFEIENRIKILRDETTLKIMAKFKKDAETALENFELRLNFKTIKSITETEEKPLKFKGAWEILEGEEFESNLPKILSTISGNLSIAQIEETETIIVGDWITTKFDYDLNLAHIHNQATDKIQRLGSIIKEQSDSFLISSFPTNEPKTIIKCEAKLLPIEIIEQLFTLIPQAPSFNLTQELDELEAEPKSYLPESYPDNFPIPQNSRLELVEIANIKQDSRTQPRDFSDNKIAEKSQKVIEDYALQKRQGVIFDPIELVETEEGELLFATGDHRLKADILNKETQTWAIIRKGTLADAIAIGALANAKQQHFNLTKKEKVNQVYRLFEAFSLLSEDERIERQLQGVLPRNTDQEIANSTGLSRSTVINIRKKLIEEHQEDPQWAFLKGGKTLGKNGKIIDTSGIGKPKEDEPFSLPIELEKPIEEAPMIPDWLKRGMAVTVTDPEAPDTKGIATAVSAIGCPVLFSNQEAPHYVLIEFLHPYLSVGDRMMLDDLHGEVIGIEIDQLTPNCYAYFLIDEADEPIQVKALDLEPLTPPSSIAETTETDSIQEKKDEIDLSYSDEDIEVFGWQPAQEENPNLCNLNKLPNEAVEAEEIEEDPQLSDICSFLVENKERLSQAQIQWVISSLLPQCDRTSLEVIKSLLEG